MRSVVQSCLHTDNNMVDSEEKQETNDLSPPISYSHDSGTEVVLHREVLDSCLSPDEEGNGEKFDPGFENWRWKSNPADFEKDSHIESIEDKCSSSKDEKAKSARNESTGRADSDLLDSGRNVIKEPLTKINKTLESHVDKSPEMEFRHRYCNNERLNPLDEQTRVIQNNEGLPELAEPEAQSSKKDEEGPVIREEASEQRIQDEVKSTSLKFVDTFVGKISAQPHTLIIHTFCDSNFARFWNRVSMTVMHVELMCGAVPFFFLFETQIKLENERQYM